MNQEAPMIEPKMVKYLGRWIPISKWVDGRDEEGMAILKTIADRLKDSGISAGLAFDRGHCCVYREVTEHDISGKGNGYAEWIRSIQLHSVKTIEGVKYTRNYKPRMSD